MDWFIIIFFHGYGHGSMWSLWVLEAGAIKKKYWYGIMGFLLYMASSLNQPREQMIYSNACTLHELPQRATCSWSQLHYMSQFLHISFPWEFKWPPSCAQWSVKKSKSEHGVPLTMRCMLSIFSSLGALLDRLMIILWYLNTYILLLFEGEQHHWFPGWCWTEWSHKIMVERESEWEELED